MELSGLPAGLSVLSVQSASLIALDPGTSEGR